MACGFYANKQNMQISEIFYTYTLVLSLVHFLSGFIKIQDGILHFNILMQLNRLILLPPHRNLLHVKIANILLLSLTVKFLILFVWMAVLLCICDNVNKKLKVYCVFTVSTCKQSQIPTPYP